MTEVEVMCEVSDTEDVLLHLDKLRLVLRAYYSQRAAHSDSICCHPQIKDVYLHAAPGCLWI